MTHNFILRLCYTDVYNVTIDDQGPVVFLWITVMRAYLPPPIMRTLRELSVLIIFHFDELNLFSDSHPLSRKEAIELLMLLLRIGNNFLMKLLHMREHSARARWKSK